MNSPSQNSTSDNSNARRAPGHTPRNRLGKKRAVRWIAQGVALLLVAWGIWHTVRQATEQLRQQQSLLESRAIELERQAGQTAAMSQRQVMLDQVHEMRERARRFWQASPLWLVAASGAYILGMLPAGWFWRESLLRLSQPVPLWRTFYAYCLGHLGKYFPGKAMVIILRVGVLAPLGVLKVATTLTIFLETLTMMAVGSALAALALLVLGLDYRWSWLALALMGLTFLPTLPPLLRHVLRRMQPGIEPLLMEQWLSRVDWGLITRGWLAMTLTWLANGLSLYCILLANPTAQFAQVSWLTLGLSSLGACAMAVVLGFVSFLPGGAGVREVVLSMMLSPVVGPIAALAAALWIRIVWLLSELIVVVGLWSWQRSSRPTPDSTPADEPQLLYNGPH